MASNARRALSDTLAVSFSNIERRLDRFARTAKSGINGGMEIELSRRRRLAIVIALGLGQVVAYASSFYLLGVLGDAIARDVRVTPALLFTLLSGAFLLSAILGPLVGKWLQARDRKRVV